MSFLDDNYAMTIGTNGRTASNHPEWKTLVAKGSNATYPYARQIAYYTPIRYYGQAEDKNYLSSCYGALAGGSLVLEEATNAERLSDIAISKLKNKLNGYIGKAELAAPLAESREIHRLVRQINSLGMDALKALLAAKKTGGKSALKFASDAWLGFGFGVNPLLQDLAKGADAIAKYTTRLDGSVRVTGTATMDYTSSVKTGDEIIAFGAAMRVDSMAYHQHGVRFVAGADLNLRSAASYSVANHLGLKLGALPGVLWELTAFSWVVDYVATVGPWLDDMFYTLPGVVKYISKNTKYQCETTFLPRVVTDPGFTFSGKVTKGYHDYVSFSRVSLANLPFRALRIKSTDEIAKYSLTKLLNLGAVLGGRRGVKV
jgi:hypothetical protein